jgi:hypothetical protein
MRLGLGGGAHRAALGQQHRQRAETVEEAQPLPGARPLQHGAQLVAHPLRRHPGQRGRGGTSGGGDARVEPPPRPEREPHRAQDPHGIIGKRVRRAEPDAPGDEIAQAAGGIGDRRAPSAGEEPERHRQRVDGEVARAEIRLEARRAEVRDVDLHRPRQPADAARLIEDDERGSQALGKLPPPREGAGRYRQVQLTGGLARDDVPEGAPHQPGGSMGAVLEEQEPDHLAQRGGESVESERGARRRLAHCALTTQRPGQPATAWSGRAAPDRPSAATAAAASVTGTPSSRATRSGVVYRAPRR